MAGRDLTEEGKVRPRERARSAGEAISRTTDSSGGPPIFVLLNETEQICRLPLISLIKRNQRKIKSASDDIEERR